MRTLLIAIKALHTRPRSRGGGKSNGVSDENFGLRCDRRKLEASTEGVIREVQRGREDVSVERKCHVAEDEICIVIAC